MVNKKHVKELDLVRWEKKSLICLENMSSVSRERLMDPNADLTDSEIRLGKGEQIKVRRLDYFFYYIIIKGGP